MRIDKFLANQAIGSRKDIKKMIKAKRIRINGELATKPEQHVEFTDDVFVDNERIDAKEYVYLLFHKPSGYICSNKDKIHKTIFELIDYPLKDKLQVCGRLDQDVTGLVVLTNDGQFNHLLTTPKKEMYKEYVVTYKGNDAGLKPEYPDGILLEEDNEYQTRPFFIDKKEQGTLHIRVTEGRFHLVKNIIAQLGLELVTLHRIKVGPYELPKELARGEFLEVENLLMDA